ncbi:MAG: hypothetical protein E6I52_23545 [Chloroflexi bacterium]|nr:MAG: hypothetical protein E6I52_23545 [Chloroflexota bacterium]
MVLVAAVALVATLVTGFVAATLAAFVTPVVAAVPVAVLVEVDALVTVLVLPAAGVVTVVEACGASSSSSWRRSWRSSPSSRAHADTT